MHPVNHGYAEFCLSSKYGFMGLFFALFNDIITCSCVGCMRSVFLLTQLGNICIMLSPSLLNSAGTINMIQVTNNPERFIIINTD